MKILASNIENIQNEKKMLYIMTKGASKMVSKLTDEELDQIYPVNAYLLYEDENSKGETITILSIMSGKTILAGQSAPFRESFMEIVDIMEDEPFSIVVEHRMSSKNRKYVTCALAM